MADREVYRGRLVTQGDGHLLADEGPAKGFPVAYDNGEFIFVNPGEPSHNERHEKNALNLTPTQDQDETAPGYAGTEYDPTEGNEHHWHTPTDNQNYEEGAVDLLGRVTNARNRTHPDTIAPRVTGHTDAYTEKN